MCQTNLIVAMFNSNSNTTCKQDWSSLTDSFCNLGDSTKHPEPLLDPPQDIPQIENKLKVHVRHTVMKPYGIFTWMFTSSTAVP